MDDSDYEHDASTRKRSKPSLASFPYKAASFTSSKPLWLTLKIGSRGSKRKHWLREEDEAIVSLVQEFGTKDWTLISKMTKQRYAIKKRSAKQCRERWHNHLDPNIK